MNQDRKKVASPILGISISLFLIVGSSLLAADHYGHIKESVISLGIFVCEVALIFIFTFNIVYIVYKLFKK